MDLEYMKVSLFQISYKKESYMTLLQYSICVDAPVYTLVKAIIWKGSHIS